MTILVTGGAGYIGSHTVLYLTEQGEKVIVLDDFSTGHKKAIEGTVCYEGKIHNSELLDKIFIENSIDSVIHFAASSLVGESVTNPLKYYENNVMGTFNLVKKMAEYNVKNIVFSSTAATYGEPKSIPIKEEDATVPTNPYGETKLAIEKLLKWSDEAYGLKSIALRYFNAAGADPEGRIGEDHNPESHLIPIVLQVALRKRNSLKIFGDDYSTEDGTCIRDYIHVLDLAQAHYLAVKKLREEKKSAIYNLGNGTGFSVKQVVDACEKVTGRSIPTEIAPRRAGDPAILIASSQKAQINLQWKPQYSDLESMVKHAWNWHQNNVNGYNETFVYNSKV
ncbi:UDP-glucose 4-epimerase GalE [Planomicrobium sp. CPCC 101110]|uniref:UDP-glucose 4-epimerase GalE n=1 Tax=Planomicrobium sp. CPCC 101110 TaxID=2599619 RepID=UPI0011B6ECF2|nr:UDP-glucose 4-epimerase GalE [Planomicrobium sp. CPCC 101110]TWT27724.1 UDP-glucose 4-epimerase GalE [Planomicrobium sp. CPCC 101110]